MCTSILASWSVWITCMLGVCGGQKRWSDSLELQVQAVVSRMWVLGTKQEFSVRARALNCWAVCPALHPPFLIVWDRVSLYPTLAWPVVHYIASGWPQIYSSRPASAPQVLGWQAWTPTPASIFQGQFKITVWIGRKCEREMVEILSYSFIGCFYMGLLGSLKEIEICISK